MKSDELQMWRDEETLRYLYQQKEKTTSEIGNLVGCHKSTVGDWLDKFGIEIREAGRMRHEYNDEETLRQLYIEDGLDTYQIAEEAGCTQVAVSDWLDEYNISARRDGPPEELRDESFLREKYHGEGMSMNAIGNELGCACDTVIRWMDKHGIEKRDTNFGISGYYPELRDEEQMREWYVEEEKTYDDIAEIVGCDRTTVGNALEELGIAARKPGKVKEPPMSKEELEELYYEKKLSLKELAERYGKTSGAARRWCEKHDIDVRGRGAMYTGEDHHLWNGGCHSYYGPTWYEQRRKVLKRDEYRCRDCGMGNEEHVKEFDEVLHVHHIERYDGSKPSEPQHRMENLVSLCQSCHLGTWEQTDQPELATELLPE